ncbi:hypothetical protein L917_15966 [Phytophthora nicotianae]|nr:hypothetical protein L915_16263 [Phytophthora nicotianae]ETL30932.1 hypothetical protein L916_16157 [Phytophthora nicotianae]ETL84171.1 hypothetical protein L917_15966 [Phytophthora nicotianae]ETO65996.1 hypothetical protein F444_16740 [Phytophthora nicotianae P1976]
MKVSTILAVSAATVLVANAESYSEPDQAIWIDRHNYFRRTGLPWSAGNMRRIDWDADLATKAASTASKCSATCGKGINAFQTSLTNASSAIDEAIQQWVVETGVTTIKTMAQPGSSGLDVGVGYYNSYSQILWAETTSVGCATATCSGGELVVCEYSPPGNDGKSPWYNHASQGSECPDGTTASGGLCIDEGNDANSPIAPIPDGKYTYQVYPAFVTDIQTILLNTARDIANGSIPPTTQSSNSTSSTPEATTATPSKETTPSSKTKTSSSASSSGSSSSESSTKQETPKKAADTKLSSESSPASQVTQDDGEQAPGTVKASSETGSTFQNAAKTPAQQTSTSEGSIKEKTESLTTSTGEAEESSHGMTTLGMVSMFILGIAAVAGIVMFVHYRVSTKRQNDILLDGGVHQ